MTENKLVDVEELKKAIMAHGVYPAAVRKAISEAPAVEAVAVIRCRVCAYATASSMFPDKKYCTYFRQYVNPDGFCNNACYINTQPSQKGGN